MIKVICDKCGDAVHEKVKSVRVCSTEGGWPVEKRVDLCEKCFDKLYDWLEEGKE